VANSTVLRGLNKRSLPSQRLAFGWWIVRNFANAPVTSGFGAEPAGAVAEYWLCEIVMDAGIELSPEPQFQQGRCAKSAPLMLKTQDIPSARAAVLSAHGGLVGGSSK
jgi:hypothetical protein